MPQPALFITREEFQAKAAKGEKPEGGLRKSFVGEVKALEGQDRTVEIRISTSTRDRDHDSISPTGWKLINYRKNPVVLYGHDYRSLPIGQDTGITADELGLLARPKFCEPELYPLADTVYRMLLGGFLRAASVGMNPLLWSFNEEARGYDFQEQELLEYSIVPVPANPEALVGAKAAGIDLTPMKAYAEELLDTWHGEAGLWLPRKSIERALQLASGEHLVITVPADIAPEQQAQLKALVGDKRALTVQELLAAASRAPAPAIAHKSEDPPAEPPTPADPAAPPADEPVLELVEEPAADEGLLDLDPEDVKTMLATAVEKVLGERLTALSGRLD